MDAKSIVKSELDAILSKFYVEATKKDTKFNSKSLLCAIRFGIQRYFKAIRSDVDTIDDPEFLGCNVAFKAQCVKLKKLGLAMVEHKPPICPEDMKKLYASIGIKLLFDVAVSFLAKY